MNAYEEGDQALANVTLKIAFVTSNKRRMTLLSIFYWFKLVMLKRRERDDEYA